MRTPISSVIYLLESILRTVSRLPNQEELTEVKRHGRLILSQLTFMQLFVEDLLNLKMLHDGIFDLVYQSFDPNELFSTVCETFLPLVKAKSIRLMFEVVNDLVAPNKH